MCFQQSPCHVSTSWEISSRRLKNISDVTNAENYNSRRNNNNNNNNNNNFVDKTSINEASWPVSQKGNG